MNINRRQFGHIFGGGAVAVALGSNKQAHALQRKRRGYSKMHSEVIGNVRLSLFQADRTNKTGNTGLIQLRAEDSSFPRINMTTVYSRILNVFDDIAHIDDHIPVQAITPDLFRLVHGWDFYDDYSRKAITNGAWEVSDYAFGVKGKILNSWISIRSVGYVHPTTQIWYKTKPNMVYRRFLHKGHVNEAIQVDPYAKREYLSIKATNDQKRMARSYNRPYVYDMERKHTGCWTRFVPICDSIQKTGNVLEYTV